MPDAFDILGLPPRFALSASDVRGAYLARAGSGVDAETLNAAKGLLIDPEKRANALLQRLGEGSPGRSLPGGFLETMMRARESLESAGAAETEHWVSWAEGERDGHIARVGGLFMADPVDVAAVRRELNAWRYIERMLEQVAAR